MTTRRFPFEDALRLHEGEQDGGIAWTADERRAGPVVIFLHGTNERGPLHRWFGAGGDLRETFAALPVEPFVALAPSQTKDAARGARLWSALDLAALVDACPFPVDRRRAIVVGHSGACCNLDGGIFSRTGDLGVIARVAIDGCMDAAFGARVAAFAAAPFFVFWTPGWVRDVDAFAKAAVGATIERIDLDRSDAHDAIVPVALAGLLPRLLRGA